MIKKVRVPNYDVLINRALEEKILNSLRSSNKAVIIYGPRQVGKTTLVKQILGRLPYKALSINADEERYVDVLSSRNAKTLGSLVSGYELLFIDEAQRVPDIGLNLKILADALPTLKIVATGSSSFDLASKVNEPLTGRAWTYSLFPISISELAAQQTPFQLNDSLEERLVFGGYPEVVTTESLEGKARLLGELGRSNLYKDVLQFSGIKHSTKIRDLLKLLAFQIGGEASLSELGNRLDLSKDTVAKYVDLLEKAFIVFRLSGFSRNLRNEVSKMDKVYFHDNGIRNAVIDNFKPLKDRADEGQLWENFLVSERRKLLSYSGIGATQYYWRTYDGAEIDYVEEAGGKLHSYEFKYGKKIAKLPDAWLGAYGTARGKTINPTNWQGKTINRTNWLEFVTKVPSEQTEEVVTKVPSEQTEEEIARQFKKTAAGELYFRKGNLRIKIATIDKIYFFTTSSSAYFVPENPPGKIAEPFSISYHGYFYHGSFLPAGFGELERLGDSPQLVLQTVEHYGELVLKTENDETVTLIGVSLDVPLQKDPARNPEINSIPFAGKRAVT